MITFGLLILLFIIWSIPAGEKCPKCESYMTHYVRENGGYFHVSGHYCFKCKHRWGTNMDKGKK